MRILLYYCLMAGGLVLLMAQGGLCGDAANAVYGLRYASAKPEGAYVHFYLAPDKTVVDRGDLGMVFDYENRTLTMVYTARGLCESFPLSLSGSLNTDDTGSIEYRKRMAELVGKMESVPMVSESEGMRRLQLVWGVKANAFRTAGQPSVDMYGFRFTPGNGLAVVDDTSSFGPELRLRGQKRADAYRDNPLLCHLDILGLVHLTGGLPVKVSNWGGLDLELREVDTVRSVPQLKDNCR